MTLVVSILAPLSALPCPLSSACVGVCVGGGLFVFLCGFLLWPFSFASFLPLRRPLTIGSTKPKEQQSTNNQHNNTTHTNRQGACAAACDGVVGWCPFLVGLT